MKRKRFSVEQIVAVLKQAEVGVPVVEVYQLYREEGLTLRYKPRRRRCAATNRRERCKPTAPNQVWSLDFVADQLADGRRSRALTVADVFTRESLAIEVGQSLKGEDVVHVLSRIGLQRAVPKTLFCDNGTEFVSAAMDLWAYTNGVILDFSRRGKPTDNATIESFNGRFREECLNVHWFASLEDAQQKIDAFRWDYNENHPHRALKGLSPREYARRAMKTAADSLS